jgi:hypothetical protein
MLFLLPFLLIPLIEFIDFKNGKQVVFTSLILTCGLITDSIIRNNLFEPVHFGVFKEIAAEINDADKDFSRNNITYATNSNSIDYINYYIDSDLEESIVDWMNPESVYMMSDRARNATTPFFCYTFNNAYQIPMFNEVIRRHYPGIERRFLTKYSTYNLYTKRKRRVLEKPFARAKTIDSVTSNQEFSGVVIPEARKSEFLRWLKEPEQDGMTGREKALRSLNLEQSLALDWLVFNGMSVGKLVAGQKVSEKANDLRQRLSKGFKQVKGTNKRERGQGPQKIEIDFDQLMFQ